MHAYSKMRLTGFVGYLFYSLGPYLQISPQKAKGLVGFRANVNVLVPVQVLMDGVSKVFC